MDNVTEAAADAAGQDSIGISMDNGYSLLVSRKTEEGPNGKYVSDVIDVFFNDPEMSGEPLYTLSTGNYFAGE